MDKKPTVQFELNKVVQLKMLFNDPIKSGTNTRGVWHMYTVEINSVEHIMFATDTLNQILNYFKPLASKLLTIKKVVRDVNGKNVTMFTVNGKSLDDIKAQGSPKPMSSSSSTIEDGSIFGLVSQIKTLSDEILKKYKPEEVEEVEEEPNEFDRYIPKDDSEEYPF